MQNYNHITYTLANIHAQEYSYNTVSQTHFLFHSLMKLDYRKREIVRGFKSQDSFVSLKGSRTECSPPEFPHKRQPSFPPHGKYFCLILIFLCCNLNEFSKSMDW